MQYIIQKIPNSWLQVLLYASIAAVVWGNLLIKDHIALPNIGMLVGAITSLFYRWKHQDFKGNISWKMVLCILGFFMFYLVSEYIHFESIDQLQYILQLKSAVLAYGLYFLLLPKLKYTEKVIFHSFSALIFFFSLITMYRYLCLLPTIQEDKMVYDMYYFHIIPFDYWHHTLGYFVLLVAIWMFSLISQKNLFIIEKYWAFFLVLFCFFMLHFLGSRTTVFVAYILYGYQAFRCAYVHVQYRKWVWILTIPLIVISIILSPSMIHKLKSMADDSHDLAQNHLSSKPGGLTNRAFTYKVTFEMISENPDIWRKGLSFKHAIDYNNDYYDRKYPNEIKLIVHNQFLYYILTSGLYLTMFWIICLLLPLWFLRKKLNIKIVGFYLASVAYLMLDLPLNYKEVYCSFCFFWIFMSYIESNPHSKSDIHINI